MRNTTNNKFSITYILAVIVYLFTLGIGLQAQVPNWELLAGIEGGPSNSAAYDDDHSILYVVKVDGLYRSLDEGEHWQKVLPLNQGSLPYRHQFEVDASEGKVAVIQYEFPYNTPVLYYSTDEGETWELHVLPAGSASSAPILKRVALFKDYILLNYGEGLGVYYSLDHGATWTEPVFFQSTVWSTGTPEPLSLIRGKHRLYLQTQFQVYYTDNGPEDWASLPLPATVTYPSLKFANGEKVLLSNATNGSVFYTYNSGQQWTPTTLPITILNSGLLYGQKEDTILTSNGPVYKSVFPFGTAIPLNGLVTGSNEYFRFWTKHYLIDTRDIQGNDWGIYSYPGKGVARIRLDNLSPIYSLANKGLPYGTVERFVSTPAGMVAQGPTGIFRYHETAQKWDTLWLQANLPPGITSVTAIADTFWIVANYGRLYQAKGIGSPFEQIFPYVLYMPLDIPMQKVEWKDSIFYLFNPYISLYSKDSAKTWMPIGDLWPNLFYQAIIGENGHFLIIHRNEFSEINCYITHDWGSTWEYLPDLHPHSEEDIYYKEGRFFAFNSSYNSGSPFLWRSLDNGYHWEFTTGTLPTVNLGLDIETPLVASSGNLLYFSPTHGYLYVSEDFGDSWISFNTPGDNIPAAGLLCLSEHNGTLYMGTGALGVWRLNGFVSTHAPAAFDSGLRFFPNPTQDYLKILPEGENSERSRLVIYDLTGRICWQGMWRDGKVLSVEQLPAGIYQAVLYQDERVRSGRFVKQ